MRGLPPISIHVGTHEMLLDDSRRFAEKARAQGVDVSLKVWEGMWHVFHMFDVPEAHACVREIGAFLGARFGDVEATSAAGVPAQAAGA